MPQLDGSSRKVPLGQGYAIIAPGLRGTATVHGARPPGDRSGNFEQATESLDAALAAGGLTEVRRIELDVGGMPPGGAAPGAVRAPSGEPGLVVEVPDLGETVEQVVLAVDEEGVVTWNFPLDAAGNRVTGAARGAGGVKRFVIRAAPPPPAAPPVEPGGTGRGLFGAAGRTVLKVLVFPVTDALVGPIAADYAARWEAARRFNRLRPFGPDDYQRADVAALGAGDLDRLAGGRALLFVHGTFSTTHGGFAALPRETVAALHDTYGGRVFAFDHFTLSVDPEANADLFRARAPRPLDIDIVCHSRGGLVARAIAGELLATEDPNVRVGRIVFVGAANEGTILADPDHWVELIDRYTTLLNIMPPGTPDAVGDTLEAIITVVKVIGHGILTGLDGLAALRPDGDFMHRINLGRAVGAEHFAIASQFEPGGSLKQLAADAVMDRVFERVPNDLVVPTSGVFSAASNPAFPVPAPRVLQFDPASGVAHSGYFGRPETSEKLREWLAAD